ncbi:MAG: START domain-containing protein [Gammaproteobacteria bacterium]|nr:START domain-containing protein [Gammaproteobacteria bacterium]
MAINFSAILIFGHLLIVLGTFSLDSSAQEVTDWILKKEADEIKVYTRRHGNSPYLEFKGEVIIDAPFVSVLALLDDVEACEEWVHRCKMGKTLAEVRTPDEYDRVIYQITQLPFPLKNRDAIYKATVTWGKDNQSAYIQLMSMPDYIEGTDFVRIRESSGSYEAIMLNKSQVKLTWMHWVDPEGILPAFIVNSLSVSIPFQSLKRFREKVKEEKYQGLTLNLNTDDKVLGFHSTVDGETEPPRSEPP